MLEDRNKGEESWEKKDQENLKLIQTFSLSTNNMHKYI